MIPAQRAADGVTAVRRTSLNGLLRARRTDFLSRHDGGGTSLKNTGM